MNSRNLEKLVSGKDYSNQCQTKNASLVKAMSFCMSPTIVRRIILETCSIMWRILLEKSFLKASTTLKWKEVALGFEFKWNFPNYG